MSSVRPFIEDSGMTFNIVRLPDENNQFRFNVFAKAGTHTFESKWFCGTGYLDLSKIKIPLTWTGDSYCSPEHRKRILNQNPNKDSIWDREKRTALFKAVSPEDPYIKAQIEEGFIKTLICDIQSTQGYDTWFDWGEEFFGGKFKSLKEAREAIRDVEDSFYQCKKAERFFRAVFSSEEYDALMSMEI